MPYPILTLPYPFAKRLRQLLNPFELKELQRAAGPCVRNELKPIVKSCNMIAVRIGPKDRNDYEFRCVDNKMVISKVNQLLVNTLLDLWCVFLNNSNFENVTTTKLSIKSYNITFYSCHITKTVLENVSKIAIRPRRLEFRSSLIDKDVTFATIINTFPTVNCIMIKKAYSGWLYDLKGDKKDYRVIDITHDNFDELFSFKPADLYDFVKNQCPQFYISLTYVVSADRYPWIIHMMNKFIDPRFSDKSNKYFKIALRVHLRENVQIPKSYYYYYKK